MLDAIFDLTDSNVKRELLRQIGLLRTKVRVRINDARRGRTNQQNKWYHSCIVKSFSDYWSDVSGEPVTAEQAHEWLADKFLTYTVTNEDTGEFIEITKSTSKLNTKEMVDYCELCRNYLAESCHVIVPDPDPNWKSNDNDTQRDTN